MDHNLWYCVMYLCIEHVFDQEIQDGKSTHTVEVNIGEVKDAKT